MDPPVVVTSDYLTLNQYKPGAITDGDALRWLKEKVCAN